MLFCVSSHEVCPLNFSVMASQKVVGAVQGRGSLGTDLWLSHLLLVGFLCRTLQTSDDMLHVFPISIHSKQTFCWHMEQVCQSIKPSVLLD